MSFSHALHLANSAPSHVKNERQTMVSWLTDEIFDHPDFDEPCLVKASAAANELAEEVTTLFHHH